MEDPVFFAYLHKSSCLQMPWIHHNTSTCTLRVCLCTDHHHRCWGCLHTHQCLQRIKPTMTCCWQGFHSPVMKKLTDPSQVNSACSHRTVCSEIQIMLCINYPIRLSWVKQGRIVFKIYSIQFRMEVHMLLKDHHLICTFISDINLSFERSWILFL